MPLVMDTYELFKPEATAELEQKAQDASAGHGVNVYLLTVSDIGGQNVREFAKDWYRDYDPVSYTHLDVYKRQTKSRGWSLSETVLR